MKGSRIAQFAVLCITASLCIPANAQNDDWRVSGSNTLRLENYTIRGDPAGGPYARGNGQTYDEFSINAYRQYSPYDSLRLQFYGLANNSAYRSANQGLVPERFNVTRENGDALIPYRLEAGDIFAAYSFRSLQRGLRGMQVELQPQSEIMGARHSLIFSTGRNQLDWRHLNTNVDEVTGASWLMDFNPRTRMSVNYVYDFRRSDFLVSSLPDRRQNLWSAAGATGWDWGQQRLRFESELGRLAGDTNGYLNTTGTLVAGSGSDRRGYGSYAQFSGNSATVPLDYRVRYERYDRDYQPANAVIQPDHSAGETHVGWRFANGLAWRARIQHFMDAMQSGNSLRTKNYGTTLSGPLGGAVSGTVDMFWQSLVRQDRTVDQGSYNLNAGLSRPLPDAWVGNLSVSLQQVNNKVPGLADTRSEQIQISGSHALRIGDWSGTMTPGMRWRRMTGNNAGQREWAPQVAFALGYGSHSVAASYGYQKLVPEAVGAAVVEVNALRLDYRHVSGQHTFGIEASAYDRHVTVGQFNDTYKVSAYWTYSFEHPRARAASAAAGALAPAIASSRLSRTLAVLLDIAPGSTLDGAVKRLAEAGILGGTRQGNAMIFDVRLLDELSQRQRLVIENEGDRIERVAFIIDLPDPTNAPQAARDYEQVRRAMLDRFGPAMLNFEDGSFGPNFAADLSMNRLVRVMQWSTQTGALRLGIPRRLDGQARIEIQHASRFGAPRETMWSMENIK